MRLSSPTVVGFGISNASTYSTAIEHSKGAIIGSAFIKFLEDKGVNKIADFISSIRD
jgi:tryptophan synthase alpha chain